MENNLNTKTTKASFKFFYKLRLQTTIGKIPSDDNSLHSFNAYHIREKNNKYISKRKPRKGERQRQSQKMIFYKIVSNKIIHKRC